MHIGKSASIGVDLPKVLRHAALMSSKLAEAGLVMTAYGAVPCQPPPQSPYVSGAACSGEGGGSTGTRSLRSGSHGGADALGGRGIGNIEVRTGNYSRPDAVRLVVNREKRQVMTEINASEGARFATIPYSTQADEA